MSASAPGGRAGAGFAAFSAEGEGVLFGGASAAGLVNSTLLYNETRNQWSTLRPTAAPTPRRDFGFGTDEAGGSAVLFGGLANATTGRVSNATWKFSFATNNWTNITQVHGPPVREDPALAVGDGLVLVYGGRDPNASGSGQLVYSDTWAMNLTTDVWTRVGATGGTTPGPLFGGSIVWDPGSAEFLLFGGCYPCSSSIWGFSPSTLTWTDIYAGGSVPPPRMGAVWSWDGIQQLDVLFGGTNGTQAFGDTYILNPSTWLWTRILSAGAPSPRANAAADFLAVPGNETFLMTGGENEGSILSDSWRLAPVAELSVWVRNASSGRGILNASVTAGSGVILRTNASGGAFASPIPSDETVVNASAIGFLSQQTQRWIPPASNLTVWLNLTPLAPATVIVHVTSPSGVALFGVRVNVTVGGRLVGGSPRLTNDSGIARFFGVPSATGRVLASLAGFHSNNSTVYFPPGGTRWVNLTLATFSELLVHTLGTLPNGTVTTLELVTIEIQGSEIGATDPEGWLNVSTGVVGPVKLSARAYGFTADLVNLTVAYTGNQTITLTLSALPFPSISVEVVGITGPSTDTLVKNASVAVASASPLPTGFFRKDFATGNDGSVSFSPPTGNYTVVVSAPGFETNASTPLIIATSGAVFHETVVLSPIPLSSFHVLVLSSAGDHPSIAGATVVLNFTALSLGNGTTFPATLVLISSSTGWANFSGLPASTLRLTGSAPGYYTNTTTLSIQYGEAIDRFVLELTPLPPVRTGSLKILSPDSETIAVLVLLPAVALIGALVYLTMLRNPSRRESEAERSPPPSGAAPGERRP